MADYPPYMNAYGNIARILEKMKGAQTPEKYTQDYLKTVLGFSGGSAMAAIPLLKRIGFLGSDGSPTEIYRRFRNPQQSGGAMADALRKGYSDLYTRNEYAHLLSEADLQGLVMEMTGLEKESSSLRAIVKTFLELKKFAAFDGSTPKVEPVTASTNGASGSEVPAHDESIDSGRLRFSYSIYLNLPNTTDVAVFNAIFKALKENLLG